MAFEPSDLGEDVVEDSYTDTVEVTSSEGDKTSSEEEEDSAVEQCSSEGSSLEELEGEGVGGRGRGRGQGRGEGKGRGRGRGRGRGKRRGGGIQLRRQEGGREAAAHTVPLHSADRENGKFVQTMCISHYIHVSTRSYFTHVVEYTRYMLHHNLILLLWKIYM